MTNNAIDNIYLTRIHELADDYIDGLSDSEDERYILIKKTPVFKGMLKYIYINLFKITDTDKRINNRSSNIDYSNIDTLNNIWDIYTGLCYKYCQNPTMLNFCLFTGINPDTINSWSKNDTRGYLYFDDEGNEIPDLPAWRINHKNDVYRTEPSNAHSDTVKKWLKECESAAYDVALSGNPGGMFILKANYGYSEAPQQIQFVGQAGAQKSMEQIAADLGYKGITDGTASVPDPDF